MTKIYLSLLVVFASGSLFAQQAILPSGGDAVGDLGTVSYSIGLPFYLSHTGEGGSVTEGVQQSYITIEDMPSSSETPSSSEEAPSSDATDLIETSANTKGMSLIANVFPNPTADRLTLTVDINKYKGLQMMLFDINGRVILQKELFEEETTIDVSSLAPAIYLLRVMQKGQQVKAFKIIKNR